MGVAGESGCFASDVRERYFHMNYIGVGVGVGVVCCVRCVRV